MEPERLVVHSGALIFCVENQGVMYWGVPLQRIGEADPPVIVAVAGQEMSVWEARDELTWYPSHPRVSAFLDDLAYLHAFCYGALHTAESPECRPSPEQIEWLEQNWGKAKLTAMFRQMHPDAAAWFMYPIYVREGQALTWYQSWWAVASTEEALDEIARELGITWQVRHTGSRA